MQINILAVLVSAIASMVVGGLWYGPFFGKAYTKVMGWDQLSQEQKDTMKKGMYSTYFWQFIASVVMFYVLAWLMIGLHKTNVMGGLQSAFMIWLGFILPLKLGDVLWGGKKILFWIGVSNSLVTVLVGGAILGLWR